MCLLWKAKGGPSFREALREQRWDDHRYYHHSRINQTLHFFSASTFVAACIFAVTGSTVVAALLGWFLGMCSRQVGHFFFEPKDYDEVNRATHAYKESIKVGYNLRRKVVLMSVWAISPLALLVEPSLFGTFRPHVDLQSFVHNTTTLWLWIGVGAALTRTVHLFFLRDIQTGLVWFTKILTDPLHDIYLYHKAPLALLKGELIDPMSDKRQSAQQA